MLQSLHIKNLALISEEEITFGEGLNILTGETGAGKSVVIGSVNLALGARADADMIRSGESFALSELSFLLDEEQKKRVVAMGFTVEEDDTLLISRKIAPGKSTCRVNGETVTTARLKELAEVLIHIHGQNDQASLLRVSKQKELLDEYCGEKLKTALDEMRGLYEVYRETERTLAETEMDAGARLREMDLLRYEIDEIRGANLREGEEEQLDRDFRRMSNARRIGDAIGSASASLFGTGSGNDGFSEAVSRAYRELSQVMNLDESLEPIADQLSDIDSMLQDLSRAMADAQESLIYDEQQFRDTQERLDFLRRLQDKYGDTTNDILKAADERERRYEFLNDLEERKKEATAEQERLLQKMRAQCDKITSLRKSGAGELSERIRTSLVDCNFLDVRFEIVVEEQQESLHADGWDTVRYDIQTNPGEAMRELSSIASGGELSRIMLGIKTVLADQKDTPTLIFDEIDAGISGKTAWKVAEKLGTLGHGHQIICITHLPQIAAMADEHFCIEKNSEGGRTYTRVRALDEQESIDELARLLSADEVTDEVRQNAIQLKERATKGRKRKAGNRAS
ncbi:MAG: DNA repair protein RecN [Lachnospiraceae bacterium]|nr:DNA repair protein RecN [Lachnospiraceae bacterium]